MSDPAPAVDPAQASATAPAAGARTEARPSAPRAPELSNRRKLLYSLILLCGLALLLELALRLWNPEILQFAAAARSIHQYDRVNRYVLRPERSVHFGLTRGDGSAVLDFDLASDADGLRRGGSAGDGPHLVHCIGDSFTMGWGVAAEQCYPAQLAGLLGPEYRVLNCGWDGIGLLATRERSRALAARQAPELLIYQFIFNDFAEDEETAEVRARGGLHHSWSAGYDALRRHSYLLNLPFVLRFQAVLGAHLDEAPPPDPDPAAVPSTLEQFAAAGEPVDNETTRALAELQQECRARGARLAVVLTDRNPESYAMARFCGTQGIECYAHPFPPSQRIRGDGHLDAAANRRLAELLYADLFPAGTGSK